MYLQRVTNIDEEGALVGRHGDPGAVAQRDLEAGGGVGAEHRDDLRVGVLAEPGHPATAAVKLQLLRLGARRVVVDAQHGVAVVVQDQPREGVPLQAQPFRHELQHLARHPPHRHRVLVEKIAACTARQCQHKRFPKHNCFFVVMAMLNLASGHAHAWGRQKIRGKVSLFNCQLGVGHDTGRLHTCAKGAKKKD